MKSRVSKLVSMLCVVSMLASALPVSAFAADGGEHDHDVPEYIYVNGTYVRNPDAAPKIETGTMKSATFFSAREAADNSDYIHDFTAKGLTTAGIYTAISGKLSGDAKYKLPISYNGTSYTQGIKMESSTEITFNAPEKGTMIVVCSPNGGNINLDGKSTAVPADGVIRWEVTAGSHTVSKASKNGTSVAVAYMEFKSAHTHAWSDWTIDEAATCIKEGKRHRTCSADGCDTPTQTETIPMIPHTPVDVAKVPASCVVPGSEAGTKCSVCQTVLSGCEPIPASGQHNFNGGTTCTVCGMQQHTDHTWDSGVETKAATCTEAGEKLYTCTIPNCGETKKEPVTALGHDMKNVDAKEVTCTEAGWDAYQQCSRCDHNTKVVKPALGHIDENGDKNCDRCGNPMGAPLQGAGGWLETMYVETDQFSAADVTDVSWTGPVSDSFGPGNRGQYDMDFLVRTLNGKTRIDIPGLRAGKYTLTVTAKGAN